MNNIDLNKPVKFIEPFPGEESLVYRIISYEESTGKCHLKLIDAPPGINPDKAPRETASILDLENI